LTEGLGRTVCPERALDEKGAYSDVRCFVEDGGRPSDVGVQAQASNHHELLGSRVPVVSVDGKRRGVGSRQVSCVESNESEPLMTCRDDLTGVQTRAECCLWDRGWGRDLIQCPTGARHEDGENAQQASMRNRRTCRPDAKGAAQVEDTTSARVPKRGTGAEVPVVGLKVL
jgi:hypothetical protein